MIFDARSIVRLATLAYAAGLRLTPPRFRRRYATEMRATFEALADDAGRRGRLALASLLARETVDLGRAAVALRRPPSRIRHANPERKRAVTSLWQDVRFAARMLKRQPAFTLVAVLTLALGIGANTAVFTVVNGVLLRPLPYGDPDRLVVLLNGREGRMSSYFSPPNYLDMTAQSAAFADHAAYSPETANLTGIGEPVRLRGAAVAWNFFRVLDVAFPSGRAFLESDAQSDAPATVVLSAGAWKRIFGGRSDIVGATVKLDGKPTTVIGIAPDGVKLPATAEFWRPLIFTPRDLKPTARGAQWIMAIARLKPGTGLREANSALTTVAARLAAEYPRTNEGRLAEAVPLQARLVRNVRSPLVLLLAAVGFVLLIACVNVANLLLARAQARTREVAVRFAIGASRRRVVQQFLCESALLGLLGAAGGLLIGVAATRGLVALGPASIPRLSDVTIDARVLGFTIAIALLTSIVFGAAPSLLSSARGASVAGRGTIGAPARRVRKALVVCEMALAVVLLIGAGLLVRSYERLQQVRPGFDPDHVLTFNLAMPGATYKDDAAMSAFVARAVDRIASTPGVTGASAVFGLPLQSELNAHSSFRRPGDEDSEDMPSAWMRVVTPGYFATMRIPMTAGRDFTGRDDADHPEVVIINAEAARQYWPGRDPVGQQIHLGVNLTNAKSTWKTIVGVVGDVKYGGLDVEAAPELYVPHAQQPVDSMTVIVRTPADPMRIAPAMRSAVASLDPDLPVDGVRPMTDIVGASVAERRFTMLLLAAFAAVAVTLAAVGVYGVLAYVAAERTQEIGVRVALGATAGDVVRLLVGEGSRLGAIGVALGAAAAAALTRTITSLLFGVTATDPLTFAAVMLALMAVAVIASYVPARRAARIDPMQALRSE